MDSRHTRVYRGWCLAALGRADDGIALLGRGLAGLRDSGFMDVRLRALRHLADACRMAGQLQAALDHLAEARHAAEAERSAQAERLRLTGDVLLAMGDPTAAEANYHEAIAVAEQQSANFVGTVRRDEPRPALEQPGQARRGP
jgi:predicted negative regulator of RcsB-dependent stress response